MGGVTKENAGVSIQIVFFFFKYMIYLSIFFARVPLNAMFRIVCCSHITYGIPGGKIQEMYYKCRNKATSCMAIHLYSTVMLEGKQ